VLGVGEVERVEVGVISAGESQKACNKIKAMKKRSAQRIGRNRG
jgi:coenzyme F420-reducing hydrogenase delta subunit